MTNKTKPESCKTELCQYDSATRTRFYNGMLLTAEHLREEQAYHREALRRVNRYLFGSGVVCGLGVHYGESGFCVTIDPGVAIDCCGNLIEVCKCIKLDLSKVCKDRFGDCNPQGQTEPLTKYLVLRYKEIGADPQPVLTPASECKPAGEGTNCEASSTREGYCVELWDKCPCAEPEPDVEKDLFSQVKDSSQRYRPAVAQTKTPVSGASTLPPETTGCLNLPLPCSPCGCCETAVGIDILKFNCDDIKFEDVDQCACRRHVMSPGLLSWILSQIKTEESEEMKSLYRRVGDRSTANLIAAAIEFNRRGDDFKNLDNEMKKLSADVVYLRDVGFKQLDNEIKEVDSGFKNLREVEFKNLRDVEMKQMVNAEIKKRDAEIKKRGGEIEKLRDDFKRLKADLKKQNITVT